MLGRFWRRVSRATLTLSVCVIVTAVALVSAMAQSALGPRDLAVVLPGLEIMPSREGPSRVVMKTWRTPELAFGQSEFTLTMYWNGIDDETWPFTRILDALLGKACGGVRPGWTQSLSTLLYATASLDPERDMGGNGGVSFRKTITDAAGPCRVTLNAQGARWHTIRASVSMKQSTRTMGVFQYRWNAPPPSGEITVADVQNALIWTRHYGAMVDGDYGGFTKRAAKEWQQSRGYPPTDMLSSEQMVRLVSEGLQERDRYGWAMLTDNAVGFAVGIPTAIATSISPTRDKNGILGYSSNGTVGHRVIVGSANCSEASDYMSRLLTNFKSINYQARKDDWFVISGATETHQFYIRSVCRPTGTITAVMSMPFTELDAHGFLFVAMTNNLVVQPFLNPNASPNPRLVAPAISPGQTTPGPMAPSGTAPQPRSSSAAPLAGVERSGKTSAIRLILSDGSELRPREVFERVSDAVFVVHTADTQGSAVAVSDSELLTNCHILGTAAGAILERDGQRIMSRLVSANPADDRCILKSDTPLKKWVRVRPYADIKTGERAFTIGAPQGFELSIAEGIVSSKRIMDGDRLLQTSAPISKGSSGGGLFDAQGNLLGITTWIRKDAQNLNFAIAAEEYAK